MTKGSSLQLMSNSGGDLENQFDLIHHSPPIEMDALDVSWEGSQWSKYL